LYPPKPTGYGIPLGRVTAAVRASNNDVGGRVLEISGHEQFIRGRGYVKSVDDLEQVVVGTGSGGVPIRVADVASVSLGPALQRGQADLNGEGITVGGIVVMRYGENALEVIDRVKQRLEEVEAGLPEGVEIVAVYDRSELIKRAIETLKDTLAEEMIVVSLVIVIFLLHLRSALVAIVTLPIAILMAFIESQRAVVIDAMQQVGPSIFFALLVITVSFIPVFALEGTEGRLFKPLAFTKTYSMFFAALLSVTLIPALVVLVIRGRIRGDRNKLNRALTAAYRPVVLIAVRFRWMVVTLAVLAMASIVFPYRLLGSEFMPPLNEGSILYMPTALPGISIAEATRVMQTMDRELMKFPEVERVFGKVGRSSSPTDPAPLSMLEANIMLKHKSEWREGMTWDRLIGEMDHAMRFPGMPNIWWMPIQTRTEMLATGIRSTLGIKVFGPDLATIERTAVEIERSLLADERTAPHTRSAFAERATGGYFLDFDIDRAAAARFGLNVGDVQTVIEAAMGGVNVGETVEGRERYGILVRYAREYRDNLEALKRAFVATASGAQIPITQVADIEFRTGPPMLRNEDGQLVSFIFVDVNDEIGIADYVQAAKEVVEERAPIPEGYRIAWAGQFQYYERAKARLEILVPLTIFLIFVMLYMHRRSLVETAVVMLALPFSLIGSVWLIWLLGYKLSVAVAVGMIAVAGLAVELGVLMMLYLDIAWRDHRAAGRMRTAADLTDAIVEGAALRLRPKLMTGLALFMGLVPIMYSSGSGADVMKRIAAPMLGGVGSALILVLIVFPAIFSLWRGRGLPAPPRDAAALTRPPRSG
jgi:Cu(I)/Ag(I) efflux system membrane protein CusA/SilA